MDRIDRELLRRAWDCLDTFKQAYPENWHEEDEQVMKDLMAADVEFTQRHDPWKNVALRLGEELSSVGPDGYYDMHPGVWLNWAMAQQPRGKTSLPEQEPVKLWLWKNFVGGKPEYWAFDNPFPTFMDSADPQTIGVPCGYALLKPSRNGRPDRSEEYVLNEIKNAKECP